MSEEKRKPTPEEKAKAAAEAREKAEALRKLKEEEAKAAAGEAAVPLAEQKDEPTKPVSEMTPEEKAKAKAAAAAAAAAKAKAAKEAANQAANQAANGEAAVEQTKPVSEMTPEEKAKAKAAAAAAAAAKAKAAKEATNQAANGEAAVEQTKPVSEMTPEEKAKAKAAAAAAAAAKAKAAQSGETSADGDAEAKAKAAAAAKAKAAAAAAAKAKAASGDAAAEEAAPKAPSKNQPILDQYVKLIAERFGSDVIESSYINDLAKEVPTLVIKNENWHEVAQFINADEALHFEYLSNLHGVDYEDRMEVYYHFYSYKNRQNLAIKVKTNRENSSVPSVMDIWQGANWNERETYDLLGINFPGHKNLTRIMLPDDWVGHPLRKDYVQYDEEV